MRCARRSRATASSSAAWPIDIDELRLAPDLAKATLLLEDRSPPLSEIVDVTLKWSRNIYAETLLMSMSPAGQPATTDAGLVALRETLDAWQIPAESYLARDGSGLSRYDYCQRRRAAGAAHPCVVGAKARGDVQERRCRSPA